MSDTTSTTDGKTLSDTQSSSVVDSTSTSTSAPATGSSDSQSSPSSGDRTDATTSPSSGDSRRSDREGLLAAVRSVVDKNARPASEGGDTDEGAAEGAPGVPRGQDAASGATGDTPRADTDKSQTQDDQPLADPTEADLRKLRPETRRRIEQLLAQRNEVRTQLEAMRPEIEQHRQLQGYLQQHQLAPEDVNVLLGVGAALRRRDYKGFLDGVTPYVLVAQEALGMRVSPDLQRQVDDGMLSDEAARELTATRHRANMAEQANRDHAAVRLSDQQQQSLAAIRSAVEQWEAGIRTRDPDYAHKADTVRRTSQGLLQERGIPRTPEHAVALVQSAYDEVNRTFASLKPAPQPTRRTPSSVHVATTGASPEPKTMKEAALLALANMRRAS